MSTTQTILWGINRPDGSAVTRSPQFGSSFWRGKDGHYGQPDHEDGARHAGIAAKELADALIHQGVRPDDAKHQVVRIVIETTITRTPIATPPSSPADMQPANEQKDES